jgi:hypothetical protein
MEKKCTECKIEKNIDLFVKARNLCKDCMKEYKKSYQLKNKDVLKEKGKKYYLENKDNILERVSSHYENNKYKKLEYQKEYAQINKEKVAEYKSEYAQNNKEKIREYKNNYQNRRRKEDPIFMLKYSINRSIRNSLKCKGLSKNKKSIDILGCDIKFFKEYLEVRFTDDMNWSNYGVVWDIDHIIPLATATNEDDIIRLNHYTNLQPLDSYVNRFIKRDKIDFEVPD